MYFEEVAYQLLSQRDNIEPNVLPGNVCCDFSMVFGNRGISHLKIRRSAAATG